MIIKHYSASTGWQEPVEYKTFGQEELKQLLSTTDAGLHYDVATDTLTIAPVTKGTFTPCDGCDQMLMGAGHACPGRKGDAPTYRIKFSTEPDKRLTLMRYLRSRGYSLMAANTAVTSIQHTFEEEFDRESADLEAQRLVDSGAIKVLVEPIDA